MIAKIFLLAIKLATGALIARLLGPAGRGFFFISIQTAGLSASIGALSVGEGLIYAVGKGRLSQQNIFSSVVILTSILSLPTIVALYFLLPILDQKVIGLNEPNIYMLIIALVPAMVFEYIAISTLKAQKLFKIVNTFSVFSKILILLSLLAFFILHGIDIKNAILSYVFAGILNAFIVALIVLKSSLYSFKTDVKHMPFLLSYGIKVHVGTLLNEVEYRLDAFILFYFLNAASVGVYSIAAILAQMLWYSSNSINTVLFPYLVGENKKQRDTFFQKVIKYSFYLNALLLIIMLLVSHYFIIIIYGIEFAEAYFVFLILAPGLLLDTISRGVFSWLKGSGQPWIQSWVSVISLIINIALNIFLIPVYGMYGAAFASTISYGIRCILLLVIFSRISQLSLYKTFYFSRNDILNIVNLLKNIGKGISIKSNQVNKNKPN